MSDGYQEQLVPKRFSYRENLICSVVKEKNPIKGLFPDASDAGAAAALLHNSARRICLSKQKAAAGAADLWGLSQIAMSSTRSWIKQRCSDAFAALERGGARNCRAVLTFLLARFRTFGRQPQDFRGAQGRVATTLWPTPLGGSVSPRRKSPAHLAVPRMAGER